MKAKKSFELIEDNDFAIHDIVGSKVTCYSVLRLLKKVKKPDNHVAKALRLLKNWERIYK